MPGINEFPLISCLCVTKNRPEILNRAINCFYAQTYPNKELIIVCKSDQEETISFLKSIEDESVHSHAVDPDFSLGDLRNISVDSCNGQYFCQWDDDDWYHSERLMIQFNALRNNYHPVCLLTNLLIYDELHYQAYLSGSRLWENSIMCQKDLVSDRVKYPSLSKEEDTVFTGELLSHYRVYPLVSAGLYIYIYNGCNTWNEEHFKMLFSQSQKFSNEISRMIRDIINGVYSVEMASNILNSERYLKEVNYFAMTKNTILY